MRLRTRVAVPLTITFALLSVVIVGMLAVQDLQAGVGRAERDLDIASNVLADRAASELAARREAMHFLANATSQTEREVALVEDEHLQHALWQGNVLNLMAQRSAHEFDAIFVTDATGREMWRYERGELVTDHSRLPLHGESAAWQAARTLPEGEILVWLEDGELHFVAPVLDLRGRLTGIIGGVANSDFLTKLGSEHLYSHGFVSEGGATLGAVRAVPGTMLARAGETQRHEDRLVRVEPAFRLQAPGDEPVGWHAVSDAELAPIRAGVLQNAAWVAAGTGLTLLALVGVVFVVLDRALRPLHYLTKAVDQMQTQDHDLRRLGSDELDDLALKIRERGRQEAEAHSKLEKFATLGSLSAGVAHEVNNPLAFMRCNAEISLQEVCERLERPDLSEDEQALLRAVKRTLAKNIGGIDRITRIVQSLRLLAKPSPERRPLDLATIVQATVDLAGPKLKALEGLEIEMDEDLRTTGSPDTLGQVVLNLLLNAADAVPAEAGRVWVRGRRLGDRIELRVGDNGPGLSPQMRTRVFQPFATTKAHGTGLGLSISYRIIHEHDGELRYEDRPGGGACFVVDLPVREAGAMSAEAASAAAAAAGPTG